MCPGLLVAHDCGYPLSGYTCRATRVAADFLDFIAFCRCSTGVALHPLKILVSHLAPPVPGGVAPKFGSEKVSRYMGVSQLQLRVSRYTVQIVPRTSICFHGPSRKFLDLLRPAPLPPAQKWDAHPKDPTVPRDSELLCRSVSNPFSPLQPSKTPETPNLCKICPSDCFGRFQSGGLKFGKICQNLSENYRFSNFDTNLCKFQSP